MTTPSEPGHGRPDPVAQQGGVTVTVFAFDVAGDRIRHIMHPRGVVGHLVGGEMALRPSNRKRNVWAVSLLGVRSSPRPPCYTAADPFSPRGRRRVRHGRGGLPRRNPLPREHPSQRLSVLAELRIAGG